jgi:hypothetical protein
MHELSHPFHQPQRPHNRGRLLTVNNIPQFLPQSTHCHCSSACCFRVLLPVGPLQHGAPSAAPRLEISDLAEDLDKTMSMSSKKDSMSFQNL